MPTNWKKLYVMKQKANDTLNKIIPNLRNSSGIYIFKRRDENNIKWCYIGQCLKFRDRLISHILGYSQRIDISIKKRGWFSKENPHGWILECYYCPVEELDKNERADIKLYADNGWQLYNRTLGGQGEGKVGINDGQSNKGYREGVAYGRKQAIKEVKTYFDKYLVYDIKEPRLTKDGKPVAIKQKKLSEFEELLDKESV